MYGAAEATARMTCINSKFLKTKIESIGKPIINGKLSIQNENGKEILETGKKGELVYEGENIFIGYANSYADLNINKKVLRLKTGDIGFKDNEGYFYISGKKSRYVKVYGHRVNLDDIEKIINFYGVRSVCVQNKKDTIHVYINKKNNKKEIQKKISDYTSLNINSFKIKYVKSFPLNKNMKIDYENKIFKI